eukprot:COSAG01_NODE_45760_length_406_cov_1.446254_1_plen_66_part_00
MGRHIQQGITRLLVSCRTVDQIEIAGQVCTFDGCAYRGVKELASDSDTDIDTDTDTDADTDSQSD